MKTTDSKYRYDLITGQVRHVRFLVTHHCPSKHRLDTSLSPFIFQPRPYEVRLPVSDKAIGKRIHGEEGLGPEAPHRGNAELRESRVGRFFMPLPGGKNHHYRQVHTEPQTQHSLRRGLRLPPLLTSDHVPLYVPARCRTSWRGRGC